jgi:hypothetical protein
MELLSPAKNIQVQALAPDVVQSCILFNPVVVPTQTLPAPIEIEEVGIITPVPPTVTYENLPVVTILEDNSPDQIIGCLSKTGTSPQSRLSALFPGAVNGDGVVARDTNDVWVYDGAIWENAGPNPGPRIVTSNVIPPYNLSVALRARTSTKISVKSLPYALELTTEIPRIKTSTKVRVKKPININLLPVNITTATGSASVITGFSTTPTPVNVTIGQPTPEISTGASIQVPSTGYLIQGHEVDVPRLATRVAISASAVGVNALQPAISSGASISVPYSGVAVGAVAPRVNLFEFASVVGTKAPILGTSASSGTYSGWTSLQFGSADDAFVQTPSLGFNFTINNTSFSTCFVSSNGYITFGSGTNVYISLGQSNPALNKLFFVPGDRSYQRVDFKVETDPQTETKLARIRWEGNPGTSGTVGLSSIIAEITLFEAQASGKQFIELVFGNYDPSSAGSPNMLIANTSTSYVAPAPGAGNTSWVFEGNVAGTAWTMTSNRYVAPLSVS